MPKPSKKLIEETRAMMRLKFFLEDEVGLKTDLSLRELKEVASILRQRNCVIRVCK
jgi:hypothetical protein